MDLLKKAKALTERVEAEAAKAKVPVAVCIVDVHGNLVLQHRMNGAPLFSLGISERKAYTSALVRMRTADLLALVQPGQPSSGNVSGFVVEVESAPQVAIYGDSAAGPGKFTDDCLRAE